MKRTNVKNERLVVLFLLGCVLFSYPFVEMFNLPGSVFGIPVLYLYVFAAWAAVIAMAAAIVRRADRA